MVSSIFFSITNLHPPLPLFSILVSYIGDSVWFLQRAQVDLDQLLRTYRTTFQQLPHNDSVEAARAQLLPLAREISLRDHEEVQGAFAEYCRIPSNFVIALDPRLSFVDGATIPANYVGLGFEAAILRPENGSC